jgi:hypothetical protein
MAFLAVAWSRMRTRRTQQRREEATGHRREASVRDARARREAALADEAAHRATSEREMAQEHAERARNLDPDLEDEHAARAEHERRERTRH